MKEIAKRHEKSAFHTGMIHHLTWQTGHPLPIEGCMIMLCHSGCAEFSINSHAFSMNAGMMAFVAFDMVVLPVGLSSDFEVQFLALDFEITQDIFFLVTSNRFWDYVYKTPIFPMTEELQAIVRKWFSIIGWIDHKCSDILSEKLIRNEAENFMLAMSEQVENKLGQLGESPAKNRAWTLLNDFIALLNRHYARHHDVAFYASCLNVTPNYLNIIVRKITGTSVKEQINIQIGLVIRTLLDTTDLSIKQISERLHYEDPSYLCRIFRKQTGMSPIQYRNKIRLNKEEDI